MFSMPVFGVSVQEAEDAYRQGDYALAEQHYASFVNATQTPENLSRWLYRLGLVQLARGRANEGVASLIRSAHESVTGWAALAASRAAVTLAHRNDWARAADLETRFAFVYGEIMTAAPEAPLLGQSVNRIVKYIAKTSPSRDPKSIKIALHGRHAGTYLGRWLADDLGPDLPENGGNLLSNPGFELDTEYKVPMPHGWMARATNPDLLEDFDGTLGYMSDLDAPRTGAKCAGKYTSYGTPHGWFYQTVSVQPGVKYECTVFGRTPTRDEATGPGQLRLGVDLTGGTDPNAGSVQWTSFVSPRKDYEQMGFSGDKAVVATSDRITLFLELKQDFAVGDNVLVFDDAVVKVTSNE